jgi:putative cardiolipin synthase
MRKEKNSEEIRFQKRYKTLLRFLCWYTLFLFSGFLFSSFYHRPKEVEFEPTSLYGQSNGPDGAVLVEDRLLSGISRINLIEHAQSSLQIAYHTVHDGLSADIFYGALLEAAERGVTVQLLFDGILHNLRANERETYLALAEHPNIRVRFYEPLNLLKPWALNNRLHDKFIVVDRTLVLLGGRNIGDKYFLHSTTGTTVEDRDVLILNLDSERRAESVLAQFDSYFEQLWNHSYTKERRENLTKRAINKAQKQQQILLENLARVRREYPQHFFEQIAWHEYALPTQKVTLITNSLERVNKTPHGKLYPCTYFHDQVRKLSLWR